MKNSEKENIVIMNHRFVRLNCALFIGMLFVIFAFIVDNDDSFIFYAIVALILVFLLIGWILSPICCVVNAKGIKIIYAFGKNTFTDFNQIRKIYIAYDTTYNYSLVTRYNYVFEGLKLNKKYMSNAFMKCKKLEKALLLYAKGKLNNQLPK
ncbi:MAG: hypothetical protein NC397_08275 [Clostridium sp.]|nr:hypothetical protein [Clostridium sp.]